MTELIVKARCGFIAPQDHYLSFQAGDVLVVLKRHQNSWLTCCHPGTNKSGLVPSSFLQPPPSDAHRTTAAPLRYGDRHELVRQTLFAATPARPAPPAAKKQRPACLPQQSRPVAATSAPLPPPLAKADSFAAPPLPAPLPPPLPPVTVVKPEPTPVEPIVEPIVEPTPVELTPVELTPVEPTPVELTPVEPIVEPIVESTPVEPTPVEPTLVEPTPVEPTPIVHVEPSPRPVQPAVDAAIEPTVVDAVAEPAAVPAREPTPTPVEPVVEPEPVRVEPVVEPTPVEPTPVEPVVEPTPVEPVVEPTPVEPTPVEPEPVHVDAPAAASSTQHNTVPSSDVSGELRVPGDDAPSKSKSSSEIARSMSRPLDSAFETSATSATFAQQLLQPLQQAVSDRQLEYETLEEEKRRKEEERVLQSVELLVEQIMRVVRLDNGGWRNGDGTVGVTYGRLFSETEQMFDALVGTLKAARKKRVVAFVGEMLLMPRDQDVEIVLLSLPPHADVADVPLRQEQKKRRPITRAKSEYHAGVAPIRFQPAPPDSPDTLRPPPAAGDLAPSASGDLRVTGSGSRIKFQKPLPPSMMQSTSGSLPLLPLPSPKSASDDAPLPSPPPPMLHKLPAPLSKATSSSSVDVLPPVIAALPPPAIAALPPPVTAAVLPPPIAAASSSSSSSSVQSASDKLASTLVEGIEVAFVDKKKAVPCMLFVRSGDAALVIRPKGTSTPAAVIPAADFVKLETGACFSALKKLTGPEFQPASSLVTIQHGKKGRTTFKVPADVDNVCTALRAFFAGQSAAPPASTSPSKTAAKSPPAVKGASKRSTRSKKK